MQYHSHSIRSAFDAHIGKKGRVQLHGAAATRHVVRLRRECKQKAANTVSGQKQALMLAQLRQCVTKLKEEIVAVSEERDRLRTEVCMLRTAV